MRETVVERIKKVVQKVYPDAKVLIFGSCATGINLPASDIDLLVYYPAVREITMINKLTSELIRADICASIPSAQPHHAHSNLLYGGAYTFLL